jgi:hypothetical protein
MAINLLLVSGCPVLALPRIPAMGQGGIVLALSEQAAFGSRSRLGAYGIAKNQARLQSTQSVRFGTDTGLRQQRRPPGCQIVHLVQASILVNSLMVNARHARVFYAHFSDFLPVFARFIQFKNPVKYRPIFAINHSIPHVLPSTRQRFDK